MKHTINIISIGLCQTIRSIFPNTNVMFALDSSTMKTLVLRSKDLLISYLTMIGRLTKIDFSLREKDPWKQRLGYQDDKVDKLMHRIDIIYSLWATHSEIVSVISPQNKKDLERLKLFDEVRIFLFVCYISFELLKLTVYFFLTSFVHFCIHIQLFIHFDPLDVLNDTDLLLKSTLHIFNTRLQPLDNQIAKCIQEQVQNLDTPPFVILSTFEKLPHILQRQGIKKNLNVLITRLTNILKELLVAIDKAIDDSIEDGDSVKGIFKCRQYSRKIEKIRIGFKTVAFSNDIEIECVELKDKCNKFETKIFSSWLMTAGELLETTLTSLEQKGTLIELHNSNILRVTFHNDLAKVVNQERKLRLLGFKTDKIAEKVSIANKYYALGSFLNKSIMLRNSITKSVSLEQRDLLHNLLVEFDDIVEQHCEPIEQRTKLISWTNDVECERFASKLNDIANALSIETKNAGLLHLNCSRRICALFAHDLLSQKPSWLRHYHEVEGDILDRNLPRESKWVTYWEYQIFKVFEATYMKGLLYLNTFFKDLRCEMVANGDKIDIDPPLSEIRSRMYAQLQAFVEYPGEHKSIFTESALFEIIPRVNEKAVGEVYKICERSITELKNMICQYSKKIVINFDISSYAKLHCQKARDFAASFEWWEIQRSQVEKWPEIETYHSCVKVSLRRLKNIVVDRLLFFRDSLEDSLRCSALNDYQFVKEFMSKTTFLLAKLPSEVDEICQVEIHLKVTKLELSNIEHKAALSHDKFELLMSLNRSKSSSQSFLDKRSEMKLIKVSIKRFLSHQFTSKFIFFQKYFF